MVAVLWSVVLFGWLLADQLLDIHLHCCIHLSAADESLPQPDRPTESQSAEDTHVVSLRAVAVVWGNRWLYPPVTRGGLVVCCAALCCAVVWCSVLCLTSNFLALRKRRCV